MIYKCNVGDNVYAKVGGWLFGRVVRCEIEAVSTGLFGTKYVVFWKTTWVDTGHTTNSRELVYWWRVISKV